MPKYKKKKISNLFCTKNGEQISLFGLKFGRKRSGDSVTGGPIFANLVSEYP